MSNARHSSLDRLLLVVGGSPALARARQHVLRAARITHRSPAPLIVIRQELPHLLNRRRLLGCGVEVGVKRGEFSEMILDGWAGRHLISVDPWQAADDSYVDVANVDQRQHDEFHAETLARLARFGGRSSVWRLTGAEAAARIPHSCLDFVYLDARHDYDSVREDLETWFGKVRPGGVIAGHDYVDGRFAEGEFGVRSAVDGFFAARRVRVRATLADPPWRSWWVIVPRRT